MDCRSYLPHLKKYGGIDEYIFYNQFNSIPSSLSCLDDMEARMSGKGDKPRPMKDRKKFDENFDRIFGKRKEKKDGNKTNTK